MTDASKNSMLVPVIVALITGTLAGMPALLNYINTPQLIEGELRKIRVQSEAQLKLQRDQEVAKMLATLSDPDVHVRAGAALSLSVLGGEEIVPILVGKLRESASKLALLEMTSKDEDNAEYIEKERLFLYALKQSLLTIGLPSLIELIDLNRELRFSPKQAATFASRWKNGKLGEISASKMSQIPVWILANREVKDAIRSILLKISASPGQSQSISPLAEKKISLSNTDLSHTWLVRVNLAGVDLSGADLRHSSLEESNFRDANLSRSLLQDAIILEANFENANFNGANMKDINIFSKAIVNDANFLDSKINNDALKQYLKSNGGLNIP